MSDIIVSKAGIHCVGPRRRDYALFLQAIKDAGRQLAGVKVRDDYGAIDEPVALWPEIITIGAATEWDDAALVARENSLYYRGNYSDVRFAVAKHPDLAPLLNVEEAFGRIMAAKLVNPNIVYWEYLNERDGQYNEQSDFYIALMDRFASSPTPLCIFNCASGTPKYPDEDGGVAYAAIARTCKHAKDHGYDVILGLHEYYTEGGGTIGRYKVLADYLEAHDALIPIAITEWGFEVHQGDAVFMNFVRANDPMYMADPRVLFCAAWTLGGGGWGESNYETALPDYGQHIATVAPVVVDPPPDNEYEFVEWIDGDTGESLGNANPLTFTITADRQVRAVFEKKVPPVIKRICQTSVSPDGAGSVTGGGVYNDGDTVTLTAVAA